jgi:hypothetical protein
VNLDAERSAHVLANHPDVGLWNPQQPGIEVRHHVRSLVRVIDGKTALAGIEVGQHRARF